MTVPLTPTTSFGAARKAEFPLLASRPDLVFLDSAASAQKPDVVINKVVDILTTSYANVHRGVYGLSRACTDELEAARSKVAAFIGATSPVECILVSNATAAINMVAGSWGDANLRPGDAVLLSMLEHHSNIVPWYMLANRRGLEIRWIPLTSDGQLELGGLEELLARVKLVAVTGMSNVLGTLPPVRRIADAAHQVGAVVMVDGCQLVPHMPCDVVELGADFLAFSGHKMCGPTGIGVLWGRAELLDDMPPYQGGGGMISDVKCDRFVAATLPDKFEAGTPPITEAIGLGAAVDYLTSIGMAAIRAHERALVEYALRVLPERLGPDLLIHGPAESSARGGVFSFELAGHDPHDIGSVLDEHGVCVRAGHHCAKPLMEALGTSASARASTYLYNDEDDIDALAHALDDARRRLHRNGREKG